MRALPLVLLATCATVPPPPSVESCLRHAPPEVPRLEWQACEWPCEASLGVRDANALASYLQASQAWMRAAWESCR